MYEALLAPFHIQPCFPHGTKLTDPCIQRRVSTQIPKTALLVPSFHDYTKSFQHLFIARTGRFLHWGPENPLGFPSLYFSIIYIPYLLIRIIPLPSVALPFLPLSQVWRQPLMSEAEKSGRELKTEASVPQLSTDGLFVEEMTCLAYVTTEYCRKLSEWCRGRGGVEVEAELLPSPPRHTHLWIKFGWVEVGLSGFGKTDPLQ